MGGEHREEMKSGAFQKWMVIFTTNGLLKYNTKEV
jgi:hypothetical protein